MQVHESPNTPFTILRTRFKKGCSIIIINYVILIIAPKVIIYDNACNLHNYCLNRDPLFFMDTWFLVDRLHWSNHTGMYKLLFLYSFSLL